MSLPPRTVIRALGSIALVYAAVYVDVWFRARQAYLEGERASTGQLAYAWYETAAELFSPPESRWSRLAREKMPLAKERWKAELAAKHIPPEDSLFD